MIRACPESNGLPYNEVIDITPALAATSLERNESNRPTNWNYVSQLARDMKARRFFCTHQGIAFDTEGRLIDGQHRLWAVAARSSSTRKIVRRC